MVLFCLFDFIIIAYMYYDTLYVHASKIFDGGRLYYIECPSSKLSMYTLLLITISDWKLHMI